jgi:hypothetical protein
LVSAAHDPDDDLIYLIRSHEPYLIASKEQNESALMLRLVIGFLPWIIRGVLGNHWFVPALLLALADAAVTTLRQIGGRYETAATS